METYAKHTGRRLILASASPRRRELLLELGATFDVVVANIQEHEDPLTDPRAMVSHNASLKADWVAGQDPHSVVLGADTTVYVDGRALNKPTDLADARRMLRSLSGRAHTVFTGLAFRCLATGLKIDEGIASHVRFKVLSEDVIEVYLKQVHVLDKAGSYAIQDKSDMIIEGFEGSYTNIVGLPIERTKQILLLLGLV